MMIKMSWKIKLCLADNLRESVEIVVKLVINLTNAKIEEITMVETTVIQIHQFIALIVVRSVI